MTEEIDKTEYCNVWKERNQLTIGLCLEFGNLERITAILFM